MRLDGKCIMRDWEFVIVVNHKMAPSFMRRGMLIGGFFFWVNNIPQFLKQNDYLALPIK